MRGRAGVKHLAKWTLILSSLIKEKPGNRPFYELERGTHRHSICPSEPLDILAKFLAFQPIGTCRLIGSLSVVMHRDHNGGWGSSPNSSVWVHIWKQAYILPYMERWWWYQVQVAFSAKSREDTHNAHSHTAIVTSI